MLNKLTIINYAIINYLEVDFSKGLTTITGETGTGKSIILGALNLLLGHRFESINYNNKSKKTIIEGLFNISQLSIVNFFRLHQLDYDNDLIIRREFVFDGKSRAFINDSPVKLEVLKELGVFLIDIHSQHENLLIHNENFQINLIDKFTVSRFPQLRSSILEYNDIFQNLSDLNDEIDAKKNLLKRSNYDVEYYKKLVEDIELLELQNNEKEILELEYQKISNTKVIKERLSEILLLLESNDNSVVNHLNSIISKMSEIKEYDENFQLLLDRLKADLIDINDILMDVHTSNHELYMNPDRVSFLKDRINTINSLEKKLNVLGVDNIIKKKNDIKLDLSNLYNIEHDIKLLKQKVDQLSGTICAIGEKITDFRKKGADELSNLLKNDLCELGLLEANLEFRFSKTKLSISGLDQINLFFSANKGFDLKPIAQIASGGEVARLMLCVKKRLFSINKFSTIIFDEIDAGVSGSIGRKMGNILKEISFNGQVICITHLPQIASVGHFHYRVFKENNEGLSSTKIIVLNKHDRVQEIARMLSGDSITEEAIANAKKMIDI